MLAFFINMAYLISPVPLSFLSTLYKIILLLICTYVCAQCACSPPGTLKRVLVPLELE